MSINSRGDTLTVEQKFAKCMLALKEIRPFYSAVYDIMGREESTNIDTVGVTTDKLIYNKEYVDKLDFAEFLFVMLHETAHIALMHLARMGNRDRLLWNVACDLYINKMLADEFELLGTGDRKAVKNYEVAIPMGVLFNKKLNINLDFSEGIYDSLMEQATDNGYNGGTEGNEQEQQENNQGHQGNEQGHKIYQFEVQPKGYERESSYIQVDKNGAWGDILDKGDDQELLKQEAQKIVNDAIVRVSMSSASVGYGAGGLQAIVEKMLKSGVDWRRILRKYLIASTSKDSSFARPDKRMYYQDAIYPGRIEDETNEIKGIKICIDTSGSISDEDIEYFCGHV